MRFPRVALAILVLLVLAGGGFVWWSQETPIAGIEPPARATFNQELIEQGGRLAALGNCAICHTAAGGRAYAGGRPIPTPFGRVYSSNITPALGTGLGHWSEAAFRRAMRKGVSRLGHHLYPAFPYDHYARLGDDDLHALYAFVMTRQPVETHVAAPELVFPLNQRWLLALWNLLFLERTPFRPDLAHDETWNRGAYLVAGLGHCGDCHTPRNFLGAERNSQALAGGEAEGWRAPALNAASPAPVPWDAAHLFLYLRHGSEPEHGAAVGPMREVVDDLAQADANDVRAIAAYLAALQGEISPTRRQQATNALAQAAEAKPPKPAAGEELGAAIFLGACAACHTGSSAMQPPHGIDLALSLAISQSDPTNAILIVLGGVQPADGRTGPSMPGFAGTFTDDQLALLFGYIRAHYGNGPPWPDLAARIKDIRKR